MYWLYLTLSVLAVKLTVFVIDREPMFLIGDSAVYLFSALEGHSLPVDRSFAYGYVFIKAVLFAFGSLKAVVSVQCVASAGSALLLALILCVGFRAPRGVAAAAALAYSIEPLALLYERMILTENLGLLFLAAFVLAGVYYIRRPSLWLIGVLVMLSTALVAMRTAFLPLIFASMIALPLLGKWKSSQTYNLQGRILVRRAVHLCSAVALTMGAHAIYKQWFHTLTGSPAVYNPCDGYFLLASWAPLVTRADFPDPVLYDRIMPQVRPPIGDRFARPGQRFSPDGLIELIVKSRPDESRANDFTKRTALNIARRDPLGVIALGWRTYLDFWTPRVMANEIKVDQGQHELDQPLIEIFRNDYKEDLAGHQLLATPTKAWHALASPWYLVVLLAPAIWLLAIAANLSFCREMLFLGICTIGLLATDCLLVTEPVVRYLHSIAWLVILLLTLLGLGGIKALLRLQSTGAPPNAV